MQKHIVIGFSITINPADTRAITLLYIDPQVQPVAPNAVHYVIEGNFNGKNRRGEDISYSYTAHAYVNLPHHKEFVTNMIRRLVNRNSGDLEDMLNPR
jgi:hypothetical protein